MWLISILPKAELANLAVIDPESARSHDVEQPLGEIIAIGPLVTGDI